MRWRAAQEAELTGEGGWLSITGLLWLPEGESRLPAPLDALGALVRRGESLTLVAPTSERRVLIPNKDSLAQGSVTGRVIQRGSRLGLRLYDSASPARQHFKGRRWFAPDPRFRVTARFHPYPAGKTLEITNILGDTQRVPAPGYVTFTLLGRACRLDAEATPEGLFFNFCDLTSGKTTYPAGRFLDAEKPRAGTVILDFNRAVCPPCAFTEFATCPLPPSANRLKIAVSAGERSPH